VFGDFKSILKRLRGPSPVRRRCLHPEPSRRGSGHDSVKEQAPNSGISHASGGGEGPGGSRVDARKSVICYRSLFGYIGVINSLGPKEDGGSGPRRPRRPFATPAFLGLDRPMAPVADWQCGSPSGGGVFESSDQPEGPISRLTPPLSRDPYQRGGRGEPGEPVGSLWRP
jgi:hypothetical protein